MKFISMIVGAFMLSTSLWAKDIVPLSVQIDDENQPIGHGYGKAPMRPPVLQGL
jgi:hypothetical protein